jgi:hypothetical protein
LDVGDSTIAAPLGEGDGDGDGEAVGCGVGEAVGDAVGTGLGDAVGTGLGELDAVGDDDALAVAVGDGDGDGVDGTLSVNAKTTYAGVTAIENGVVPAANVSVLPLSVPVPMVT